MSAIYNEAAYENALIQLFRDELGWSYRYGPDVARDFRSPLYDEVLEESLRRINPVLPQQAISEALNKLRHFENADLVKKNAVFMDYLQNGIEVSYSADGKTKSAIVYIADFENAGKPDDKNSYIIANQWTFIEKSNKRPDILLFLNGLPVCLFELKSPSREQTDASEAFLQIRNYMQEIPSMFIYNCICVMSDQLTSKAGTITSGEDRFMEWKTVDGSKESTQFADFTTFFKGMFQKERLLDIIKNFICFGNDGVESYKILGAYHQYFAVQKAIESTRRAVNGDGKIGVFWHTQGSGKSLSMVFYAHLLQSALESPTIVVITDRNDLDNQLYGQFCQCADFLRQEPVQAESREHLKTLLEGRKANGIIFTTMQKFEESAEPLSDRKNIIVMADEAHRGQYGLSEKIRTIKHDDGTVEAKRIVGTARIIRDSLPNASYIGFTGTPISRQDRSTTEVFGNYIDVYDMTQAVEDGATRPVYYESRVIKLRLDDKVLSQIDAEYDALSANADEATIEKSKHVLGNMEEILGAEPTINSLVDDILQHYEENRAHLYTGKALIVAYSRSIAMKIYKRILELRPSWAGESENDARVAVVMTESNKDPEEWRATIGNKRHKQELAKRFKDDASPLKIAIVVDMWLTGFDVPSLATMYVYKPMEGHNLMQAIARVNRVFKDKEGGLVVDYVGIASALNFILVPERQVEKERFVKEAQMMKQALSLCSSIVPKNEREEASFFESIRVMLMRFMYGTGSKKFSLKEINDRINELLKQSIKSEGVLNLFSDVGEKFNLFDVAFLSDIAKMKQKNLAVEMLKKLIAEQVKVYSRTNVVNAQKFSELFQNAMNRYLNGLLTNEQVTQELLQIAASISETDTRAKMRLLVKKLLKKYRYLPEGQEDALTTVISQCELWTDTVAEFTDTPHRAVRFPDIDENYGALKVADSQGTPLIIDTKPDKTKEFKIRSNIWRTV